MEKFKISIIMPAYNTEKYISAAIDSVINQTFPDWELIIVDDGSTDNTGKIIDEYIEKDVRIKVFHQSNQGVSSARNNAMERSTGDYMTFLDSDDVYHPERLKIMLDVLLSDPKCDAVFAEYHEFKGDELIVPETESATCEVFNENIVETIIRNTKLQLMCNVMMKTEIAKQVRFADLKFAEDYCFIRDCACYMEKISVIDSVLYFYRRDNANAMTSNFFTEQYVPEYMKIVKNAYEFCMVHKLDSKFYKNMIAHEYAQNAMRIRKSTSYAEFVKRMNDSSFRKGIQFADPSFCSMFEKVLFVLVKRKLYLPFMFWVW